MRDAVYCVLCGVPVVIIYNEEIDVMKHKERKQKDTSSKTVLKGSVKDAELIIDALELFVVGSNKAVEMVTIKRMKEICENTSDASSNPSKKASNLNFFAKYVNFMSLTVFGLSTKACDFVEFKRNDKFMLSQWCFFDITQDKIVVPNSRCLYTLIPVKIRLKSSKYETIKEANSFSTVPMSYKSSPYLSNIMKRIYDYEKGSLYVYELLNDLSLMESNRLRLIFLISSLFYYDVMNMMEEFSRKALFIHELVRIAFRKKFRSLFCIPTVTKRMFNHSKKQFSFSSAGNTWLRPAPSPSPVITTSYLPVSSQIYAITPSATPVYTPSSFLVRNISSYKIRSPLLKKNLTFFKRFLGKLKLSNGDADIMMVCACVNYFDLFFYYV
jgi:hypothetical protein